MPQRLLFLEHKENIQILKIPFYRYFQSSKNNKHCLKTTHTHEGIKNVVVTITHQDPPMSLEILKSSTIVQNF